MTLGPRVITETDKECLVTLGMIKIRPDHQFLEKLESVIFLETHWFSLNHPLKGGSRLCKPLDKPWREYWCSCNEALKL